MLRLIIRQTNWGIIGSVFAFAIGFFIKGRIDSKIGRPIDILGTK